MSTTSSGITYQLSKVERDLLKTLIVIRLKRNAETAFMLDNSLCQTNPKTIIRIINELCKQGKVIAIGKQTCLETGLRKMYYLADQDSIEFARKYPSEQMGLIWDWKVKIEGQTFYSWLAAQRKGINQQC